MNALIVFSALVAASSGALIQPYAAYGAGYLPYGYGAAPLAYAAPAPIAPVAPIPAAPVSSQYHAQDEFGNVNHGYSNINSAKQEVGNAYGGVTGSYQYVDAYGIPQRVDYIADGAGFRVKATNLPVAPIHSLEGPVFTGVAPSPVEDTAEVAEAKAKFFAAFEDAKNREKRSLIAAPYTAGFAAPYAFNNHFAYAGAAAPYAFNNLGYAGYGYANAAPLGYAHHGYAAPAAVVASAPATREAVLTKIQLNPGHAVSYRVD